MSRYNISCFADLRVFKTRVEYGFLLNPPVEFTVNSTEQKTGVFCSIDAQEFHLWSGEKLYLNR
jgi:hypothetical protein